MSHALELLSVNVGQPRVVSTPHGDVVTSIFKDPVQGRRSIVPHNIEGDRQSDLTVHGGPKKAVYAYASEHYDYWRAVLPAMDLSSGMFGENLTIAGLLEASIHIGDLIGIGSARLRVTQPRMPCFKLGIRFDRADMVKLFWKSNRSGVYFAVEQAGQVEAGDEVRIVETHPLKVSLAEVVSLYKGESDDEALFHRTMASPLAASWRNGIQERWDRT